MHACETRAAGLAQDVTPQLAYTAEPTVVVGGLELNSGELCNLSDIALDTVGYYLVYETPVGCG